MTLAVRRYISAVFQKSDRAAHARLGESHIFSDIYRPDIRIFLRKDQYRFKIHLTRFLQMH